MNRMLRVDCGETEAPIQRKIDIVSPEQVAFAPWDGIVRYRLPTSFRGQVKDSSVAGFCEIFVRRCCWRIPLRQNEYPLWMPEGYAP